MNSWARRVVSRVSGLFGQKKAESEFDSEMQVHLQLLTEKFMLQGMGPEDADSAARRQFGNATLLRQSHRESRTFLSFSTVFQDVRYGLRVLVKSPGFTAIAVASLALAIGANTTIFSVAKSVLYDPLGVPHPEQLRMLYWQAAGHNAVHSTWGDVDSLPEGGSKSSSFSYPVYRELSAHNQVMQELVAYQGDGVNATIRGMARRVQVEMVSGNYYSGLNVRPQLGRPIEPSDVAASGSGTVAVVSDSLWRREFGGSPAVLGQMIAVNQTMFTIVGVNPRGFTGADDSQASPDVFAPLSMQPVIVPMFKKSFLEDPDLWWVKIMGRVKPGVKDSQAEAVLSSQLQAAVRGTMTVKPGESLPSLVIADGSRGNHILENEFEKPAFVLMTLTGLVLLLACANIANLMLARGAQRQRE